MKEIKIKIKDLCNYQLSPNIQGFGLCGYNNKNGGYIYANTGYGNIETYIESKELFDILKEDGHNLEKDIIIEIDKNDFITYCHFAV